MMKTFVALTPYWLAHIAAAILIAIMLWPLIGFVGGLAAGAFFYVGREFTQWEQGGGDGLAFDWPGLLAPLLTCSALIVLLTYLSR